MDQSEEHTDAQKRILEAGLELFSRNGFKATTTRDIAGMADVNEITIFRNFGTKEKLLAECIEYGFDEEGLKDSLLSGPGGDIEEELFCLLEVMRENIRMREKVYAIMFREIATNEIVKEKVSEMPGIMKGFMLGRLKSILGDRVRDDVDLETAGIFLASYYLRSEIMRLMMGADPFHEVDEERMRDSISIFLHGILDEGVVG